MPARDRCGASNCRLMLSTVFAAVVMETLETLRKNGSHISRLSFLAELYVTPNDFARDSSCGIDSRDGSPAKVTNHLGLEFSPQIAISFLRHIVHIEYIGDDGELRTRSHRLAKDLGKSGFRKTAVSFWGFGGLAACCHTTKWWTERERLQ